MGFVGLVGDSLSRKFKDIRHLNAFWIDLDYYNLKKYKNKTAEEMIEIMRKKGVFSEGLVLVIHSITKDKI
jgi:hypothetical protein